MSNPLPAPAGTSARAVPPEERAHAIQNAILYLAQHGWHLEAQAGDSVLVSKPGRKPNHIVHLILSILTAGLWLFIWLIVAVRGPDPDVRKRLTLLPDGHWQWDE